eukprot:m.888254 g.888254  ORF g.888254 m.888254 type:complete len:519 (+) comp59927_c0_seq3:5005-6561(+)
MQLALVLAALCACSLAAPNVLILLVDDLGYGDLSCFGRQNISTPNIDALALQGIKFTQWMSAAAICTPSRAALQTGRLPRRFGMTADELPWRVLSFPSQPGGLPEEEITIAEALKTVGYATGMSGKWHLGVSNKTHENAHLPRQHGYDSWLGLPFTNLDKCKDGSEDKHFCMVMANNTVVEQPTIYTNLTAILTDHALAFIDNAVADSQPFFFFMSYVHVHTRLFSSPNFTNVSAGGAFGDNVQEMDWSVGQILDRIHQLGIDENTVVFFTSDNGPYAEEGWSQCGRSGGLKGSKGQTYEGGIRVPGIVRWTGHVPAGVVSDELVGTLDLFPTILSLAGVPLPTDRIIDGLNITSLLLNPTTVPTPHEFMWHYCGDNVTAARYEGYKIHFATPIWQTDTRPSPLCTECCPYSPLTLNGTGGSMCDCGQANLQFHDPPVIYSMVNDPFELTPLTPATLPQFNEIVATVKTALAAHYATVGPAIDQMHTLPDALLCPCCEGVNPFDSCECNIYQPGYIYP